jgi:hypothetical protein
MLREKLQQMIEVDDIDQHPRLLRELSRGCPNSVLLLESEHPIERYTCLVHALEFTEKPEYLAIAKYPFKTTYAGPEFAHWLIDRGNLRVRPETEATPGDLLFYFEQGHFKHAAVLLSGRRAVSKWGKGHLFEHDIFEVPQSYGSDLRFLERLPYDAAIHSFVCFAKENGLMVDDADLQG